LEVAYKYHDLLDGDGVDVGYILDRYKAAAIEMESMFGKKGK
jgi:hypothetical protein